MLKISSVTFVVILAVVSTAFWLKSGVSETVASPRPDAARELSLSIQAGAGAASLPVEQMEDRSFVFTDPQ